MQHVMLLILTFLLCFSSNGQDLKPVSPDTTNIAPGTIRLKGKVKNVSHGSATLIVQEVIGTGQGIVNIMSAGDEVEVQFPAPQTLKAGQLIETDVLERPAVDASRSSYTFVRIKKLK